MADTVIQEFDKFQFIGMMIKVRADGKTASPSKFESESIKKTHLHRRLVNGVYV